MPRALSSLPPKAVIGMIHLQALPGSPAARLPVARIAQQAADEARLLARAGFDALLIENMHDVPYVPGRQDPAVVAAITAAALAVRAAAPALPLGIQVLACGNREALAIALAADASFIRCENFVFAQVADEGLSPTAEAADLLRYRRAIGAQSVRIFCDIDKKHASHALTADLSIPAWAEAAEFFRADGIIVTGLATGRPAAASDLADARRATSLPLLVGSGVTPDNIAAMFRHADAVIVGSWFKRRGVWNAPPDPRRAAAFMKAARAARSNPRA
ncbi:MAG: BtpA/SgcQ family protein [Phycisphaeraceae bacterium]|nr:BtpA/SgcQ family protein [Phycisphaeraceae bacterium]